MNDQLESSLGELVLRIRGTNRRGELLRLRSPKCTIGSGQHCTLRLGSKHAEPLSCLILRGDENTIVRCSAANTRLNGQSFSEAQLSPGDVLGIGSLEFEVVSLNEGSKFSDRKSSVPSVPATRPEGDSPEDKMPNNEAQAENGRELDELKATLQSEKAALDLRNFQINQEVAAFEQEKASLEREKAAYLEEQTNFQADRNSFFEEQKLLEAERATHRMEKEALVFEKNCFEVERQNWRIEQKELVSRQEAALTAQSAEESNRIERQQADLELKRRDLEKSAEQHQTKWEAAQRQLDERDEEFRKEREQFNSLESDHEWRNLEIERLRENLRREQENFEKEQKEFLEERERFSQEQSVSAAKLQVSPQENDELQKAQAELRQELDAFQNARSQFEQERIQFQKNQADFQQLQEELQRERASVQQEREKLEQDRQLWENQRTAAAQADREASSCEVREPHETTDVQSGKDQDSRKAAVDLREILQRLGHNVDLPEDEANDLQTASAERERQHDALRPANRKVSESASTASVSEEDEESIDSYMAQWMQRLGVGVSESGGAGQKAERNTAPQKVAESNASRVYATEAAPRPENGRKRREPVELSPRAVAPEKNVDLSALRDLANLSAKHALGRHDLKQLVRATRSKLMVTLLSLAVGVGLLWHWSAHNTGKLTVFSAGMSFMIALYWGLQYAVLTGRLIVNRSGGITLRKHSGSLLSGGTAKNKTVNAPDEIKEQANPEPEAISQETTPASNGESSVNATKSEPTA